MVDIGFIDVGTKANQITLDAQSKTLISVSTETTNCINAISANKQRIVAVGDGGTILEYDTKTDTFKKHPQSETITTNHLWHIDISVGNGVAVGAGFTILDFDNSTDTFTHKSISGSYPDVNLTYAWAVYSVYGVLYDIYVGFDKNTEKGCIYTYNGTLEKVLESPAPLHALITLDLKNFIVVGYGGQIWKSTDYGRTWTRVPTPYTDRFYGVAGVSWDSIWITSLDGNIYKYNFYTDEIKLVKKVGIALYEIWTISTNDIYIVGAIGTLLHYDGVDWHRIPTGTVVGFTSFYAIEENKYYIGGAGGYIYRFYSKAYPSILIDSLGNITGTDNNPLSVKTKRATSMSTTVYTVTAASGGTQIATANPDRSSLLIQNIGTGDIYLKEIALQSGEGIRIKPDASYDTEYVGSIWAYAVSSGDRVVVSEEAY